MTLMLIEEVAQKTVAVALVDATTGVELKSLDRIEVAIAI